ncbi:MAG TPA: DUF86 domain-containing protein [Gallionella sp.]|nr:DUF86 domain-containing protein [Gallionella sp.]
MKTSAPVLRDYLGHIRDAIERINRYTALMDEQEFLSSELTQDAVLRNFEVIGEVSSRILKDHKALADAHPELPLMIAYQMRNAIAHGYFSVDHQIVWRTIKMDLTVLLDQLRHLLNAATGPLTQ